MTDPPYLFPDYAITLKRAPGKPLVEVPREWLDGTAGPSFARIPIDPNGSDLTRQHEGRPIGQRIVLEGRVLDGHGRGVPETLIEIWQANAAGRYPDAADPAFMPLDPNFTGSGRCLTDADGRYRFVTIKPAAYAQDVGSLFRPAHIHVSVFGPRPRDRLITQCYFEGDPLIDRDPIVRSISDPRAKARLIARFVDEQTQSGGYDSALVYHWDIVLRGDAATPRDDL